ncbi:MBL fold metallo-hydrolase [Streptomyces sodiiphilus]|uniref:MBL fold metallo-hydrolase n=1 Tax=Streptomyces sodiiphilus TaxID=226217 RepID=A0ABP5ALS7_9ACTN
MPVEITWWGHATATVRDSGTTVLTDPLLVQRLGHLYRRGGPVPPPWAAVADVVVVSHLHADHLHLGSLARLLPGTPVVVPRGALRAVPGLRRLAAWLEVYEVEPGDRLRAGGLTVRAVPALHDGRRVPFGPQPSRALGFVLEGEARTYYAGDTGLFPSMARETGPVDTVLLPVGGWGPTLGPGHLDPARAALALAELRPGLAVPVHYGTFWPVGMAAVRPYAFFSPGVEFARQAARYAPGVRVCRLGHGESVRLAVAR